MLAVALVVLAVVDWIATVILVRGAIADRVTPLEERATAAVILSLGASGGAFLSVAYLFGWVLPDGFNLIFLAAGFLALSIPQLIWGFGYWMGRFR